jgi:hypothetical protein
MNIAIYQTVNAHAPAIHWWLAQDKRFGPQLYKGLEPLCNGEDIGSIVQEIRNEDINADLYNIHQESLREMENKEAINGIVDCTSKYFNAMEGHWGNGEDPIVGYQYPVWSNYFGSTKNNQTIPLCDKLVVAQSTTEQSAMFYITQYAFIELTIDEINDHSKIWWEDHTLMAGKVLDSWKEIWYRDYHNQCITDFHNGKLQYMWQLNFAHWDLFDSLENSDGKFDLDYSPKRLFEEKHNNDDIKAQYVSIKSMKEDNVDHLLIDVEWFNKTNIILDYLGISNSKELDDAALLYKKRYKIVCKAYEELSNKYYKGIIL